jgi:hypothetical protein
MTSKEEFDELAEMHGFDITKWKNGNYKNAITTAVFSMWNEKQLELNELGAEYTTLLIEAHEKAQWVETFRNINMEMRDEVKRLREAIKEVDVLIRHGLPVDKTTPAWGMIKKILYKEPE